MEMVTGYYFNFWRWLGLAFCLKKIKKNQPTNQPVTGLQLPKGIFTGNLEHQIRV